MEPKKIFSTSWVQPYKLYQVSASEIDALRDIVIEQMLDAGDFREADELIAQIKAL